MNTNNKTPAQLANEAYEAKTNSQWKRASELYTAAADRMQEMGLMNGACNMAQAEHYRKQSKMMTEFDTYEDIPAGAAFDTRAEGWMVEAITNQGARK